MILYRDGSGCLRKASAPSLDKAASTHIEFPVENLGSTGTSTPCFQNLEYGQHLGHDQPLGRVCKVSPDADTATESIRNVFDGVGYEGPVVVEEAFGNERVRVGEPRFVVGHCPGRKRSVHQMRCKSMESSNTLIGSL